MIHTLLGETYPRHMLLSTSFVKSILKLSSRARLDRYVVKYVAWDAARALVVVSHRWSRLVLVSSRLHNGVGYHVQSDHATTGVAGCCRTGLAWSRVRVFTSNLCRGSCLKRRGREPAGDSLRKKSGTGAAAAGAGPSRETGRQGQLDRQSRDREFLGHLVPALPRGNSRIAGTQKRI